MILQIVRERLKAGVDAEYAAIEDEIARICIDMKCPHPYLGIESLTGPKEVWFFNAYASQDEIEQVEADYRKNAPLMAALAPSSERKRPLMLEPIDIFAKDRPDLTRGEPWAPGQGHFLVITRTRNHRAIDGAVFEAPDGTWFIIRVALSRAEADAEAAAAGPDTHVFAVRPNWSMPAEEWIAADPAFWRK